MSPERWFQLMQSFGIGGSEETFERLTAAYAEPHRHYRTSAHIDACLTELDCFADLAEVLCEVEIALWFHDAVYAPQSSDNERRSAEWAARFLTEASVAEESRRRVYEHILATRHAAQPRERDSALVVDIDLSILGKAPSAYAEFERRVREEYRWVPLPLYRRKRREILQSFLNRDRIYCLPRFREQYEEAARANLCSAVLSLA